MTKREYRPLLTPGFRELTLADLARMFVYPFPGSRTRQLLAAGLTSFLNELATTGVKGELWIDGSFANDKLNPNDVDLLLVWDKALWANIGVENLKHLNELFDNPLSRAKYHCDVYQVSSMKIAQMANWRGWFGFMRDGRTPKGIGFISI